MKNKLYSFLSVIIWSWLCTNHVHSQQYPNVILIMSDDQGWGDVSYNGHPYIKTPHLDQMARDGARFTRAYSGSAVCSPTRASFLTGRHPERMGICYANCGYLKKEEITLYELVKPLGYTTAHFGKWHLGTLSKTIKDANRGGMPEFIDEYSPPWEHGADVSFVTESKVPTWDPMKTPPASAMESGNKPVGSNFGTHYWSGDGIIETENLDGDDSRVIMDRVIPFIEKATLNKKPFLTVIWFHTPHLPVLTGAQYKKPYTGLSEDQQEFYGAITAMDEQIGRLRKHLKELGIEDNTIISFTSDNGPEGKEPIKRTQGQTYGLDGRKRSLKEGGIRVPGLMVWPKKISPGAVINTPVFTSDYFPTIASILDIDLKKFKRPFDGMDLQKVIEHNVSADTNKRHLSFLLQDQAAHIGTRYKIYRENATSDWQMFDLLTDPGETQNIASRKPDLFHQLISGWSDWEKSVKNSAAGNDY